MNVNSFACSFFSSIIVVVFFSVFITACNHKSTKKSVEETSKEIIENSVIEYPIVGDWVEARMVNDSIAPIGLRRGGLSAISIKEDKSMIYFGSPNCGFGSKLHGNWQVEGDNLVANYTEVIGYANNQNKDEVKVPYSIVYNIVRLNERELLLRSKERTLPFLRK